MQAQKITFEEWMKRVNNIVHKRTGLDVDDLDDCCFVDWYDELVTPNQAASRAIRYAKDE